MRKPNLNSRLARARSITSLDQEKFAKLVGMSLDQLRHIERGGRELAAHLAALISEKVGVSADWLLGGDASETPLALDGEGFTREKFLALQLANAASSVGRDVEGKASLDQLQSEHTKLLSQRSRAWELYLGDILETVFEEAKETTLPELLGTQIVDLIRVHANLMNLSLKGGMFQGVDDAMRELRKSKQTPAAQPKSGKVAAARSKASRPTDT
jgi:transcriptional regulator with XRE-family HTH domain